MNKVRKTKRRKKIRQENKNKNNKNTREKKKRRVTEIQQKTDKKRKQKTAKKESIRQTKKETGGEKRVEVVQRKIEEKDIQRETRRQEKNRQKRIGNEKTEVKKIYISFREQMEGMKKTTELNFARYFCAREISSKDPVKDRKDRKTGPWIADPRTQPGFWTLG